MQKHGYTLIEILTAIVIVTILIAMAAPLYEKTVERSRLAQVRTTLYNLQRAKLNAMDQMGCDSYNPSRPNCPTFDHLATGIKVTKKKYDYAVESGDFCYSIYPNTGGGYKDAVCAVRLGGDYKGTRFLYAEQGVLYATSPATFRCGYNTGSSNGANCEAYGMEASSFTCRGC